MKTLKQLIAESTPEARVARIAAKMAAYKPAAKAVNNVIDNREEGKQAIDNAKAVADKIVTKPTQVKSFSDYVSTNSNGYKADPETKHVRVVHGTSYGNQKEDEPESHTVKKSAGKPKGSMNAANTEAASVAAGESDAAKDYLNKDIKDRILSKVKEKGITVHKGISSSDKPGKKSSSYKEADKTID